MNKTTYDKRRAAGVCVNCGGPVVPGLIRCEKCLELQRLRNNEYKAQRRKAKKTRSANLQETMKAAEAEGLSYGQYVAKYSKDNEWRIKK